VICEGETYYFGTEEINEEGLHTFMYTSYFGCDSIIDFYLTYLPSYDVTVAPSICEGQSYTFAGNTYTTGGTYMATLTAQNGCDSTVTVQLTVDDAINTFVDEQICSGESVTVAGQTFTEGGSYMITLPSSGGCDSIINLTVTQVTTVEQNDAETICEGDAYMVGDSTYTVSGLYEHAYTTASGCDSIYRLDLTVLPTISNTIDEAICQGASYTLGSDSYSAAGTYSATFAAASGCDSVVTVNLTVDPPLMGLTEATLCAGDTLFANGQVYTTTGLFETMHTTMAGCDSIHQLDLTVLPPLTGAVSAEICEGSAYNIGGQSFSDAGVYEVTLPSVGGCDSVVTVTITLAETLFTELEQTICPGDTAYISSIPYTTAGTFEEIFVTPDGCDSLVELTLMLANVPVTDLSPVICQGDSYSAGGQTFTDEGAYSLTLTSAAGCDSIVNLNLTVTPPPVGLTELTICAGDTAYLAGTPYIATGTYQAMLTSPAGCDSLHELNLTVLPEAVGEVNPVICDGDTFSLGGQDFSASGQYSVVLSSAAGCDSTVTVNLLVNAVPETNLVETVCDGEGIMIGSTLYDATGVYQEVFTSADGCDSLVNLDLTVLPPINTSINAQICEGASYDLAGMSYSTSGSYTGVLTAADGCDSVVQVALTILPTPEVFLTATICEDGVYAVGDSTFTEAGAYTIPLSTVAGCDSTVYLDLSVATFYETNLAETICEGESAQFNGNTLTTAGTYNAQFVSFDGCDSLVNFVLTVNPLPRDTVEAVICQGESFSIAGVAYATAGEHQEVLPSAVTGCDSTVVLFLEVLPTFAETFSETVCFGESVEVGDSTYTTSGQFVTPLLSSQGCDSTVTLNLTVLELPETFLIEEICAGEQFAVGDSLYVASGNYTNVLTAASGCDSLVYLDLVVHTIPETPVTVAICDGESYQVGSESFTTAGSYTIVMEAAATTGCDSIVMLDLAVNPVFTTDLEETICTGESYAIGTETFTTPGSYSVTLPSAAGCDSTVNLNLAVIPCSVDFTLATSAASCAGEADGSITVTMTIGTPPYTITLPGGDETIAANNTPFTIDGLVAGNYNFPIIDANGIEGTISGTVNEPAAVGLNVSAETYGAFNLSCAEALDGVANATASGGTPPYTYVWSNGASGASAQNLGAGAYRVTVTDASGCTREGEVQLSAPPAITASVAAEDPPCFGDLQGQISVGDVVGGTPPYLYSVGGAFVANNLFAGLAVGNYTVQVQDAFGCEFTTSVQINEAEELFVDLGDPIPIELGDSVRLYAQTTRDVVDYQWSGGPLLGCDGQAGGTNCENPWVSPTESVRYSVTVTDENGCTATDQVDVRVAKPRDVFVPTAFSPNGDGFNDLLLVYGSNLIVNVKTFLIFNRWGEQVFQAYDFQPEDTNAGWDGTHRGQALNAGVFVYMVEVEYLDGETRIFSGDVLLMK
ncbi:MAG: gliding motility-associated C-terminal domain-containing protein, partial [Lewinella sp.]|nr:gliding motility-associated C-terminal domain-containing protein [Lewinella sp.]